MKTLKSDDIVYYIPTAGPHKGKHCPARVEKVLDGDLVNLEVRSKAGQFVENVANAPIVPKARAQKGQAYRQ